MITSFSTSRSSRTNLKYVEGLDLHKQWLIVSWFCDLESSFSTSLQPITQKHRTLRINTKVHAHTHNVSSLYKTLILLCDIVMCFWQLCNTDESILHQLGSRKLILRRLINSTWRNIHTWNTINYVLILFSSSVNDFFAASKTKNKATKRTILNRYNVLSPRSLHPIKHTTLQCSFWMSHVFHKIDIVSR
jgi:hypothetical protein